MDQGLRNSSCRHIAINNGDYFNKNLHYEILSPANGKQKKRQQIEFALFWNRNDDYIEC